jgi:iron uptake system EfeUOB component EfeO/EfeM
MTKKKTYSTTDLRNMMVESFEQVHDELDKTEGRLTSKIDQGFERMDVTLKKIDATAQETNRIVKTLRDSEVASLHRRVDRLEKKLGITS